MRAALALPKIEDLDFSEPRFFHGLIGLEFCPDAFQVLYLFCNSQTIIV